jgi:hypothetical protein
VSNNACRLRKYLRKKRRPSPDRLDWLTRLYWRYHFKVHGPHVNLWDLEGD